MILSSVQKVGFRIEATTYNIYTKTTLKDYLVSNNITLPIRHISFLKLKNILGSPAAAIFLVFHAHIMVSPTEIHVEQQISFWYISELMKIDTTSHYPSYHCL
jgi:hypothetical protein